MGTANIQEKYLYDKAESDYKYSLTKLLGQPIKDIVGWVSSNWDEPIFHITNVVLVDGTKLGVEGEHDCPYLIDIPDTVYKIMEQILEAEDEDEDEDDAD